MAEMFTCPRWYESRVFEPGGHTWVKRDGSVSCSYCGSMRPEDFLDAARQGTEITPTDKAYKAYVRGGGKFYFQHLDAAQRAEFIALYNDKAMQLGYPGYFYVKPYFVEFVVADPEITKDWDATAGDGLDEAADSPKCTCDDRMEGEPRHCRLHPNIVTADSPTTEPEA